MLHEKHVACAYCSQHCAEHPVCLCWSKKYSAAMVQSVIKWLPAASKAFVCNACVYLHPNAGCVAPLSPMNQHPCDRVTLLPALTKIMPKLHLSWPSCAACTSTAFSQTFPVKVKQNLMLCSQSSLLGRACTREQCPCSRGRQWRGGWRGHALRLLANPCAARGRAQQGQHRIATLSQSAPFFKAGCI